MQNARCILIPGLAKVKENLSTELTPETGLVALTGSVNLGRFQAQEEYLYCIMGRLPGPVAIGKGLGGAELCAR